MLEALRTFVGGWIAKILLVLLVGSFAVWGVSGSMFTAGASNAVATVGETNVSAVEFIMTYNRNLNNASRLAGRQLTQAQAESLFNVRQTALRDSVTSATLDEYTRTMNLALSKDSLATSIRVNQAFLGSDGKFSRQRFTDAVRRAGLRESDFIKSENGNAVRAQIMEAIASGSVLPDVFRSALTAYASEERKFAYITITPEIAGDPTAATDDDLKKYFEANKSTYKAPEYRKVAILPLEPKDIVDEASIDDETVKADYESRLDAYRTPDQRRVQQLVLSKDKADAAKTALAAGKTFDDLLAENNVKVADAEIGLVAKSALPKALQEAAFALETNKVSEVIQGPFGPTILRVTEIKPEATRPLSEVSAEIRKDLALRQAADRVAELQTEIEDIRAGGTLLKEAADQQDLKIRIVERIDRTSRDDKGEIIADLPNSNELLGEIFKTEPGEQTGPLDLNTIGSLWYEVMEIIPTRDRTYDEVKDRVAADWLKVEKAKMVATKTEELRERLEKGAELQALSLETGAPLVETALLKRRASEEAFPAAATEAGFSGDDKTIAVADGASPQSKVLMKVVEIKRAEAELSEPLKQEIERANSGAANDILEQLITKLQTEYNVVYNPQVITQALAHR